MYLCEANHKFMIYILLGYMGSGKSTLGKALAEEQNIPFYDLDVMVEEAVGRSISSLIEEKGELAFRKKEHEVLEQWIENRPQRAVLALGGGTPVFYNHMDSLNEVGETVYLDVSVMELAARLEDVSDRPLLQNADDRAEFVAKHLFERREFYLKAKHRLKGDALCVDDLKKLLST